MARRNRVPRRKQLGGHNRDRNKNPKLSPFQREQKRTQMANQPPVERITRDFPASARKLQQFLQVQKEKKDQHDARVQTRNQSAGKKKKSASSSSRRKTSSRDDSQVDMSNLNRRLAEGIPTLETNPLLKRLQKKMKSSEKKREKRKDARISKLNAAAAEMDHVAAGGVPTRPGKKVPKSKRLRPDKELTPEEIAYQRTGLMSAAVEPQAEESENSGPKRPPNAIDDFDDLVDVVAFGDRADAPPTFDVLPSKNLALLPQHHIGKAKRQRLMEEQRAAKLQGLVGQSKIATAVQSTTSSTALPTGGELVAPTVKNARLESADDFAALRERVLARYAAKNQGSFFQRRRNVVFAGADDVE